MLVFGLENAILRTDPLPRANRHFHAGVVWHITHRCHKQQFLLKFKRDREQWLRWLHQARKRFRLCVLDYIVTSNHIHLLVHDHGDGEIARSMQLIAGCTAQQFNRRKNRKGAYWEDRYFATAVQSGHHLARCLVYIDLNMVRAGAVHHPEDWLHGGYREIQAPPKRYRLIDLERLALLLGIADVRSLQAAHRQWVQIALECGRREREPMWTESIAVGQPEFLAAIQRELYLRCPGRRIVDKGGEHWLGEPTPR